MTEFVPDIVRERAAIIAGDMGGPEPTIALHRRNVWRFTWDDGRVRVYLDVRWHGRDRAEWAGSKLFVDGEERELLDGADRFRVLWEGGTYEEAVSLRDSERSASRGEQRAGRRGAPGLGLSEGRAIQGNDRKWRPVGWNIPS